MADVSTSMRKYDHGQAENKTVTEYGVKLVFDCTKLSLTELESDGAVRAELLSLAETYIDAPIDYAEVSFVTTDSYVFWIVLEKQSL